MNKATQNALSSLVVRMALVAFGAYVIVSDAAFPNASSWAKAGMAAVVFALVLALGEVARISTEVKTLTLLTAGVLQGADSRSRDDRAAVDILIAALSSEDRDTKEKAHKNLVRLTGKELPPDLQAWSDWWSEARGGFGGRGGAT